MYLANSWENALEAAGSQNEDLGAIANTIVTSAVENGVDYALALPAGTTQTAVNAVQNFQKNFGVFAIGFLLFLAGAIWFAFSWGDDLVNAFENISDKIPVPVE